MYQIYKVQPNDTLEKIAQSFGTTIDKIREINGLGEIYEGGYVLVPIRSNTSDSDLYTSYSVKKGDNIYSIAREYGVPYETLLRINGLNKDDYIYPEQKILIPKANSGIYVTSEADTIQSLYQKHKDNWDSFLNNNVDIHIVPDQMIQENY